MDTLADLSRKLGGARDIKSVVRAMKAMAASNISQYKNAVNSLEEYYRTVTLAIVAYLMKEKIHTVINEPEAKKTKEKLIGAIVFGSDQGLVGRFNNAMADFVSQSLHGLPGKKEIWVIGERVQLLLTDAGFPSSKLFPVPNSVNAITPLIGQILMGIEENDKKQHMQEYYIFHNRPKTGSGYEPVMQRILPFDERWRQDLTALQWPTKMIPEVFGEIKSTLLALIREYLFVSLFRACTESLASENESRLEAMQRADKNIGDLLDSLSHKFHRLRQSSIDEELFDVVSGFEALKVKPKNK